MGRAGKTKPFRKADGEVLSALPRCATSGPQRRYERATACNQRRIDPHFPSTI